MDGEAETMSLDKSITHGKEHRKPYRGAKAIERIRDNDNKGIIRRSS